MEDKNYKLTNYIKCTCCEIKKNNKSDEYLCFNCLLTRGKTVVEHMLVQETIKTGKDKKELDNNVQ